MKKKTKRVIVAAVIVTAAAAAVVGSRRSTPVSLVAADSREVAEIYVATGKVQSSTVARVGSELAGRIASVHVEEGARPSAGAPLVDLQPLDEQLSVQRAEAQVAIAERELARVQQGATRAQLDRARADVVAAEADLQQATREAARAESLMKEGVGTPQEVDRTRTDRRRAESRLAVAKANLAELKQPARDTDIKVAQARIDEAEANLAQTKAALGKTTITSPFDGLVLEVNAAPGENVAPGQTLVEVARTDEMQIYAEVDEDYFVRIAPGQKASLVFPSVPEKRYAAEVLRVGPEVDSDRGVVGVHLRPDELPNFVVPGLTVDVAVELKKVEGRAVPRTAVIREGTKAFVFIVSGDEAIRKEIELTAEGEEYFAVDGLGDENVILRATEVSEGDRVKVQESN